MREREREREREMAYHKRRNQVRTHCSPIIGMTTCVFRLFALSMLSAPTLCFKSFVERGSAELGLRTPVLISLIKLAVAAPKMPRASSAFPKKKGVSVTWQ